MDAQLPKTAGNCLTPKQERAIILLVSGRSIEETCAELRVSRRRLYDWRYDCPAFKTRLAAAQNAAYAEAMDRLASIANTAVTRLERVIKSEGARDGDAIRACAEVIGTADKWHKNRELSQKIDEIQAIHDELRAQLESGASQYIYDNQVKG